MADVKISQLPARAVLSTDELPVVDQGATQTSKVTAGSIAALGGGPPAPHIHGNITNDGKVGASANIPLITGTDGVVQAGAFGTAASTFCQGNDARLSDPRTPTSHESTHRSDGADAIQLVIPVALALSASQNNWLPNGGDGDIIKFSCSSNLNITGISGAMKAKGLLLTNVGAANDATLLHQDVNSSTNNRIITPNGLAYLIGPGQSAALYYDPESSRWRVAN